MFTFVYGVDDSNIELNAIDKEALMNQMKQLYVNPQKPMQRQINLCIKSGRSIGYKYVGTKTGKTFIISLSPSELQNI